jgi:hypothetical protein
VLGGKVTHQLNFVPILSLGVECENIVIIFAIHRQDQIEGGEVGFGKLSGTANHRNLSVGGGGLHPSIGWVASMIVSGASRVTLNSIAEASFSGEMIHDIFGSRGATDVAETDEEEFSHELGVAVPPYGSWERCYLMLLSELIDFSEIIGDGFASGDASGSIDGDRIGTGEYFTKLDRLAAIGFPVGANEA